MANPSQSAFSDDVADFIVKTDFDAIPADAIEKAKSLIVYHLGLAFAGSFNEEGDQMRKTCRPLSQGRGAVTVIGEPFRLCPSDSAFANCTLMRAIWRDDVVFPAGVHPGIMTLPTAFAIAEAHRLSGRDLLVALVVGYEVLGKLASAAYGWAAPLPRRPTMIFGGFGPIAVAGQLLKLDRQRMANALGYAANLGMGVPEGGQMDHFYSLMVRNATFAAEVAEAGGAPYGTQTIEGELGLYRSFFGEVPDEVYDLPRRLGKDWEILRAEYKRHHGTGQNTLAIELLLELKRQHGLTVDNVANIEVVLTPDRRHRTENLFRGPFDTPGDAYSSLPFALALVLIDGEVDPARYTERAVRDNVVFAAVQKIAFAFEDGHAVARYCRLEVETRDGRRLVSDSDYFMFPFPRQDWMAWLEKDGRHLLTAANLEQVEQAVVELERIDDVSTLMSQMVPE